MIDVISLLSNSPISFNLSMCLLHHSSSFGHPVRENTCHADSRFFSYEKQSTVMSLRFSHCRAFNLSSRRYGSTPSILRTHNASSSNTLSVDGRQFTSMNAASTEHLIILNPSKLSSEQSRKFSRL